MTDVAVISSALAGHMLQLMSKSPFCECLWWYVNNGSGNCVMAWDKPLREQYSTSSMTPYDQPLSPFCCEKPTVQGELGPYSTVGADAWYMSNLVMHWYILHEFFPSDLHVHTNHDSHYYCYSNLVTTWKKIYWRWLILWVKHIEKLYNTRYFTIATMEV